MSRSGLLYTFVLILMMVMGRLIFPFGDEPDFETRIQRLQDNQYLSVFVNELNIEKDSKECQIISSRGDIFAKISFGCLAKNAEHFVSRMIFSMVVISPIILILIFRRQMYGFFNLRKSIHYQEWKKRLNAVALSTIFPGMHYALGYLSKEAITLVVSLLIFIFFGRYLIMSVLLLTLFLIDDGNFIVVLLSLLLYLLFFVVYRLTNRRVLIITFASIILLAYFFGDALLDLLAENGNYEKLSDILSNNPSLFDKYPKILRPVITLLSGIFMTPTGVNSILIYVFSLLFSVFLFFRWGNYFSMNVSYKLNKDFSLNGDLIPMVAFLVSITTVLVLVFSVPTHSWAKYYMFLLPFLIYVFLGLVSEATLFYFFIFLNIVLFINLIFYYVLF
jgi:hypothetical protein